MSFLMQYSYLYCVYNSFYVIKLLYAISVWIISDGIGCDASGTKLIRPCTLKIKVLHDAIEQG